MLLVQFFYIFGFHGRPTRSHDELLALCDLRLVLLLLLSDLLAQLRVQLHLLEFLLLALRVDDFLLHLDLLIEILLLQLFELADPQEGLFVARQGLAHGQLVLVLGH